MKRIQRTATGNRTLYSFAGFTAYITAGESSRFVLPNLHIGKTLAVFQMSVPRRFWRGSIAPANMLNVWVMRSTHPHLRD